MNGANKGRTSEEWELEAMKFQLLAPDSAAIVRDCRSWRELQDLMRTSQRVLMPIVETLSALQIPPTSYSVSRLSQALRNIRHKQRRILA